MSSFCDFYCIYIRMYLSLGQGFNGLTSIDDCWCHVGTWLMPIGVCTVAVFMYNHVRTCIIMCVLYIRTCIIMCVLYIRTCIIMCVLYIRTCIIMCVLYIRTCIIMCVLIYIHV